MENASKALLIAGGMLIALLIIGALVLMFNQIGDYEKGKQGVEKNSQIAEFNMDFVRYTDDKGISGADVVSLINKVNDYNNKANKGGVNNSVDYNVKMSITVSGLTEFNKKYAYDKENDKDSLFTDDSYRFDESNTENALKKVLKDFENFVKNEHELGIENLKKLSSIYDSSKTEQENITNIKEKLLEINSVSYINWNGKSSPTLDTIKKYRQYSEFKSSTFKISEEPHYADNGQIQHLFFKFVK